MSYFQSQLEDDLIRDEGKRLTAYQDTNGYWTIGVGHLLGVERRMFLITEAECRALLKIDINLAVAGLTAVFGERITMLDEPRVRAMINMAFNRGEANMANSSTITPAIKKALSDPSAGNWAAVATAIKASPWAQQIGKRADRLAYALEFGKDPV